MHDSGIVWPLCSSHIKALRNQIMCMINQVPEHTPQSLDLLQCSAVYTHTHIDITATQDLGSRWARPNWDQWLY